MELRTFMLQSWHNNLQASFYSTDQITIGEREANVTVNEPGCVSARKTSCEVRKVMEDGNDATSENGIMQFAVRRTKQ